MRVLVVDDVSAVRARIATLLADVAGVERVVEAADGAQAMALARDVRPGVVVLDLHLRGETGLSVLVRLRREHASALLFIVTNDPSEHHRRECLALGADLFLDKSREFERLIAAVEAAVRRELAPG
jgi:DNA-binding NarL/FixJ family response regulator